MKNALKIADELRSVVRGKLLEDEPMSRYTTMKVGGPAEVMLIPADEADLMAAIGIAEKAQWPHRVIGVGSNLIVRDGGIEGLTILIRGTMDKIVVDDENIRAGAGATLPKLANTAARNGLAGIEWAASVPGTLGGAVAGNAGAFGGEMADVVEEAAIRAPGGKVETYDKEKINFSYRNTNLPSGSVVLSAVLRLKKGVKEEIEARMSELMDKRKVSQPLREASAGSIFRNPSGDSAGRLIDSLGFKGKRCGRAAISEKHANFIVNSGNASAADVIGLIEEISEAVRDRYGIELEVEVRIIGREKTA